jgi:type IV secretion system protein VirB8
MNARAFFQSPFKTLSFHQEAHDWYADRYQSVYASRNRWLLTAWIALGLAVAQAVALTCLVPLKTSVPFLVKEELSGSVTTVTPLSGDASVTYSDAIHKFFLGRYLVARETYDRTDLAANYRAVALMSNDAERRAFTAAIASDNPSSPVQVYGVQARRTIRIKSIVMLNPGTAQIRFAATEEQSTVSRSQDWIATLAFEFRAVPSDEADRMMNPLGFTITHYRIDQEVAS